MPRLDRRTGLYRDDVTSTTDPERIARAWRRSAAERPVLIMDTMALAKQAGSRARTGESSWVEKITDAGSLCLVPRHVVHEVETRLPKALGKNATGTAVDDAISAWRTVLLPRLRIVDIAIRDHLAPDVDRVLAADADDAPTAALALLVSPSCVFSEDGKSLVDTGFATSRDVTGTARLAQQLVIAESQIAGFRSTGDTLGSIATMTTSSLWRLLNGRPTLAAALGVTLVTTSLLWPRQVSKMVQRLSELAAKTLTVSYETFAGLVETRDSTIARLVLVNPPPAPVRLEESCARVLARRTYPCRAVDLVDAVNELGGFSQTGNRRVTELRAILRGHPAFVEVDRGWWQLGHSTR